MAYYYKDKRTTRRKNWRALVTLEGKRYYLGMWSTKEEAKAYEDRFRKEMLKDVR